MLVTPRIPFTEHHKILIHQGGLEVKAQLTTLKSATDLFAVFHFRLLEQVDMDLGTDTAAQEEEVELTNVSLIADLDDLWADD